MAYCLSCIIICCKGLSKIVRQVPCPCTGILKKWPTINFQMLSDSVFVLYIKSVLVPRENTTQSSTLWLALHLNQIKERFCGSIKIR